MVQAISTSQLERAEGSERDYDRVSSSHHSRNSWYVKFPRGSSRRCSATERAWTIYDFPGSCAGPSFPVMAKPSCLIRPHCRMAARSRPHMRISKRPRSPDQVSHEGAVRSTGKPRWPMLQRHWLLRKGRRSSIASSRPPLILPLWTPDPSLSPLNSRLPHPAPRIPHPVSPLTQHLSPRSPASHIVPCPRAPPVSGDAVPRFYGNGLPWDHAPW